MLKVHKKAISLPLDWNSTLPSPRKDNLSSRKPDQRVTSIIGDVQAKSQLQMTRLSEGVWPLPICAPNAKGISYNRYQAFNVGTGGIVLHPRDHIPRKATQPIRIILEVVGKEASQLQGFLKVAGPQAELIIANPNGISCQAGHFINTSRVLLTTGQPVLSPQGQLQAYRVIQGTLKLGPATKETVHTPLNWRNLNQVDLLARAVQFNTKLHTKRLNVITGHYEIPHLASFENLPPITEPLDEAAADILPPPVAIAIATEGGIYAQHLQLIGKEYDVSIKSAGSLHADHLTLDNSGPLTFSGDIQAKTALFRAENITQAGQIQCTDTIEIHSHSQFFHQGTTQAEQLTITAPLLELNGRLEARDTLQIASHYLHHAGQLAAGRLLEVKAQQQLSATGDWCVGFPDDLNCPPGRLILQSEDFLQSRGLHRSSGDIHIESRDLNLWHSTLLAEGQLSLKAIPESIALDKAETQGTHVIIETPGILSHRYGRLTSFDFQLKAGGLSNFAGEIHRRAPSPRSPFTFFYLSQEPEFVIPPSGYLYNEEGLIHIGGDCSLKLPRLHLDNTRGQLIASQNLSLQLDELLNSDGCLHAGQSLKLSIPHLTSDGALSAGQTLHLDLLTDYTHTRADAFSAPHLFFDTTGSWCNQSTLSSSNTLRIQAAKLENQAAGLIRSDRVQLYLRKDLSNKGRIMAGKST